jgi:hypothetical protein
MELPILINVLLLSPNPFLSLQRMYLKKKFTQRRLLEIVRVFHVSSQLKMCR